MMNPLRRAAARLRCVELIDDWRSELKRLWTIRVALFWLALGGLMGVWSAFDGVVPKWLFISFGIIGPVSVGAARLLKQDGGAGGAAD